MSEPPKPLLIKVVLMIDSHTLRFDKQVTKNTKIGDILAQIKGGLTNEQKKYEFSCFNDGIRLVENNGIDFYGIDDGDEIEIKAFNKPMAMARLSRVVPHEKDYHQIYLNSEKVGFLLKKKVSKVSGWKRRWVVLCRGFLFYYNNPKDEIPIGKMQLKDTYIQFLGSDGEKQFVFQYENKPDCYHFSCESEEEYINLMKKTMENLNEQQLRYVLNETLKGLVYLHSIKIIHHDIKAGNILLTNEGKVKLADFGVSQQYKENENKKAEDFIGSPLFMSPEVIKKSFYNNKTDIWSLGITVIEMAEGNPPNRHVTSFDQLLTVIENKPPSFKNPKLWTTQLVDFVAQCLIIDYNQRPDAVTLLWHPFIVAQSPPSPQPLLDLIKQVAN
ncbi:hypothetical protein EDI_254990 [Entamoeba dispar SAW760]|uniref:Uncharacterized protein n=1 Tax=Entamoeba dispar (strain ATCC PRA-260 / SAW760) TaxID=370354 RepID=B0EQG2_ENTDS|nr:uncharacterized protein EDI_254990 [Entamoeba dispar SAW760]EDR23217.1 hypothetical protein EDI_254990 [Entamoeba dispar SAW760]|eukprot:EDR23217.1 hypothetical protein EDI_254990 [Entamoeba dispar SAW760]